VDMLWCQGAQNIGLSNRKLICANVHYMITMHRRPRETDGQTPWQYRDDCIVH